MLLTSARVVPHIARARLLSSFGAIVTAPSAIVAVTSPLTARLNVPSRPLAVSVWPDSWTSTPDGIATGCLPIRDMALPSEHPAQHLAADHGLARPLPIADAGQHVAERVGHHGSPPFTSSI